MKKAEQNGKRAGASGNSYQRRKARAMAGVLILGAATMPFPVPMTALAELAARMDERQWITVSLQAGVAVSDLPARVLTIAYLARLAS